MDLIIFDIDGTLIHSHEDEVTCFIKAFSQVMGESEIDTDLTSYEHVTDTGIAIECIKRQFQRQASSTELKAIEEQFLILFNQCLTLNPPKTIPGSHEILTSLLKQRDVGVAIATGSYYRSALLKLKHADLISHLPLASCDDHFARIEIMKQAKQKAHQHYDIDEFRSITYVGDGPWDIKASRELDWHFIAVASNYSVKELQEWGAMHIIRDYLRFTPSEDN